MGALTFALAHPGHVPSQESACADGIQGQRATEWWRPVEPSGPGTGGRTQPGGCPQGDGGPDGDGPTAQDDRDDSEDLACRHRLSAVDVRALTFGSLFAGIGGIDLGLERAGLTCAWKVEWDDYCSRVLAKHWPDVPRFGDIKTAFLSHADCVRRLHHHINGERPSKGRAPAPPGGQRQIQTVNDGDAVEGCPAGDRCLWRVDVVAGGFPCQPVSNAGKQKAQDDGRWLWPEFARILRELRPRYAILENVPGLLTAQQGRAAQEVFGDLAELGFDARWASIPAAAVGAPHLRYRVFVVGWRLANSDGRGREGCGQPEPGGVEGAYRSFPNRRGSVRGFGDPKAHPSFEPSNWWATEPDVGRVAYGIPDRVDRLRALGNAVVPQVAEWVGRRLIEFDDQRHNAAEGGPSGRE